MSHDTQGQLHTDQVLVACGITLAVLEVNEKFGDVGVEACGRVGCNEAEDFHVAVHANPEVPRPSAHRDGPYG